MTPLIKEQFFVRNLQTENYTMQCFAFTYLYFFLALISDVVSEDPDQLTDLFVYSTYMLKQKLTLLMCQQYALQR